MAIETLEKSGYELERNKPMPSKQHARVQTRISGIFYSIYAKKYEVFSELNIRLNEKVYVPDLCIYRVGELDEIEDEVQVSTVPLAIVEILTPSQSPQDLLDKAKVYFDQGVRSYWLAIPAFKNIYVYQQSLQSYEIFKNADILKDGILSVEVDLKEVFK